MAGPLGIFGRSILIKTKVVVRMDSFLINTPAWFQDLFSTDAARLQELPMAE
jgi:hypothetical protein